jgi:predicted nucleotidyltransferase
MTRAQEIDWIVNRLAESYQPEKIILFGSYGWGGATKDSDIDLLIVKETADRFIDRWVTVRELIEDHERRVPVAPVVLTPKELNRRLGCGDQFFRRIIGEGRLVYAA